MNPDRITLDYFDGHSARAHRVEVHIANGTLYLRGSGIARAVPVTGLTWPVRSRGGARVLHLPDGASLHTRDAQAFDDWAEASGHGASLLARAEQSWRWVGIAAVVLVALCTVMYLWGLPWVARGVLALVPPTVDSALGDAALRSFSSDMLEPSELPVAEQERLRQAFEAVLHMAYAGGKGPTYTLHFHKSRIGPNAFALPGGTIVVTDELVKLVDGDASVVAGVLAHELGHIEHRHGMRAVVQVALLGVASSVAFGDFSSLLAAAPVMLGHAAYSRDAEREADRTAIRILKAAGISPLVLATFFEKLRQQEGQAARSTLGIALASHPPDEERLRAFREAAGTGDTP